MAVLALDAATTPAVADSGVSITQLSPRSIDGVPTWVTRTPTLAVVGSGASHHYFEVRTPAGSVVASAIRASATFAPPSLLANTVYEWCAAACSGPDVCPTDRTCVSLQTMPDPLQPAAGGTSVHTASSELAAVTGTRAIAISELGRTVWIGHTSDRALSLVGIDPIPALLHKRIGNPVTGDEPATTEMVALAVAPDLNEVIAGSLQHLAGGGSRAMAYNRFGVTASGQPQIEVRGSLLIPGMGNLRRDAFAAASVRGDGANSVYWTFEGESLRRWVPSSQTFVLYGLSGGNLQAGSAYHHDRHARMLFVGSDAAQANLFAFREDGTAAIPLGGAGHWQAIDSLSMGPGQSRVFAVTARESDLVPPPAAPKSPALWALNASDAPQSAITGGALQMPAGVTSPSWLQLDPLGRRVFISDRSASGYLVGFSADSYGRACAFQLDQPVVHFAVDDGARRLQGGRDGRPRLIAVVRASALPNAGGRAAVITLESSTSCVVTAYEEFPLTGTPERVAIDGVTGTAFITNSAATSGLVALRYQPIAAPPLARLLTTGLSAADGSAVLSLTSVPAFAQFFLFELENLHSHATTTYSRSTAQWSLTGLSPGTAFRWRVAGCQTSAQGSCGGFSDWQYFRTLPGAPTSLSPGDLSGPGPWLGVVPSLQWSEAAGSNSYLVQVTVGGVPGTSTIVAAPALSTAAPAVNDGDTVVWSVRGCGDLLATECGPASNARTYRYSNRIVLSMSPPVPATILAAAPARIAFLLTIPSGVSPRTGQSLAVTLPSGLLWSRSVPPVSVAGLCTVVASGTLSRILTLSIDTPPGSQSCTISVDGATSVWPIKCTSAPSATHTLGAATLAGAGFLVIPAEHCLNVLHE